MTGSRKTRRSFLAGLGGIALGSAASPLISARQDYKPVSARHNLHIKGDVYQHGDATYEQSRINSVWQAIKPGRFPELIVTANTEADVIATVQYARRHGLQIAVRGGGHNYIASYLRDGGIMLNVSNLREIKVDANARKVYVQPGVNGTEFSSILAEYGLAFPVAHGPSVAIGGYLLGGGMGWNGEHWNHFACFNVDAIDVITAAGEKLTISRDSHTDLFWAARGAGPAFCGIVTGYHLRVFPLPQAITASTYIFSIDQIAKVSAWIEQARLRQDSKIELSFILESEGDEKQCVLSAVCFADDKEESTGLLDTLLHDIPEQGRLFTKENHPMSFAEVLALTRTSTPVRLANETAWTDKPAEALDKIVKHYLHAPAGKTVVIANYRRHTDLPEDVALSATGPLFLNWSTRWQSTSGDEEHMQWMDAVAESMEKVMSGCYVNETDFLRRPHWANLCYTESVRRRLASVRSHYDPDGILPPAFELDT
ncbi:MAG: FAD-binding oxidoreductase [Gammaproteobacteria bacterium]|nr:FAD-binding oxidoreductase [Gammaproteobacteria bacterium]